MRGTKKSYIVLTTFLLIILSAYTSRGQSKLVCDETEVKQVGKQTYIETVNNKIALLAIKELGIKRYSVSKEQNELVYRLSFKRVDTSIVYNWFTALDKRKIDLRRK